MRKIKLAVYSVAIIAVAGVVFFVSAVSSPAEKQSQPVYFIIKSGEGVNLISTHLKEAGLIKNKFVFETYVWLKKAEGKFQAGSYQLDKTMNVRNLTKALISGEAISNEAEITIIEGWRSDQIADYLAERGLVGKEEFLTAIKIENWQNKYDFLADVETDDVEGFLFPDTYRIFVDAGAEDIIKKMLDNFDRRVDEKIRQDIATQGKTVAEIVTLASVIQKESPVEDMPKVADVFLKRLADNIGLQSDATVNYITGKKDLRPSLADLEIDSPYNTYKYRGLPPGPIANPGLAAIKAAVYPESNPYYYFLHGKDGKTYFAKTYEEHQRNISEYLD